MISVIVPTYNRAEKLKKCLISLTEQSYKDFEVIICDDGSTDDTKAVVREFADRLDIVYDYDTNWGGPAKPRNRGIRIAKGDFIAFLDSDDWWYPNKLELCNQFTNDYDLIFHNVDIHNSTNNSIQITKGKILKDNIVKDLLLNGNVIINSSVVVRKSIVDIVGDVTEDKNLIAVEDLDYWIRVAQVTDRFKYIDQSLGGYWVGGNISYSTKQVDRMKCLLDKYMNELSLAEQKSAVLSYHFNAARMYHTLGLFADAKKSYLKSIKNPSLNRTMKGAVGYLMCCFKIK